HESVLHAGAEPRARVATRRLAPELLHGRVVTDAGLEAIRLAADSRRSTKRLDGARVIRGSLESERTDVRCSYAGLGRRNVHRRRTGETGSVTARERCRLRLHVDGGRDLRRVEASDEARLQPSVGRVLRSEERDDHVAPEHLDELDARADRCSFQGAPEQGVLDEDARTRGRRRHGDTCTDTQPGRMRTDVEGVRQGPSAVAGELVLRELGRILVRVVRREETVETVGHDVRERASTDGKRELGHVVTAARSAPTSFEHASVMPATALAAVTARLGHLGHFASPVTPPTGTTRLCGTRVAPLHRANELPTSPAALRPTLLGRRATSRLGALTHVRTLAALAALRFHHLPGDRSPRLARLAVPTPLAPLRFGCHGGFTRPVPTAPTGLGHGRSLARTPMTLAASRLGRHGRGLSCLAVPAALAALRLGRNRRSLARPSVSPAALRLCRDRSRHLTRPTAGTVSCLLRGGTVATSLCTHVLFLSSDYGANAVAECDRPLDLETLRVELPNPDVLIRDVNLAVPVPVTLRPRLGFRLRPTGASIEEQGLDVHRRLRRFTRWGLHDAAHDRPRRRKRSPTSDPARFAEVGESVVVQAHATDKEFRSA